MNSESRSSVPVSVEDKEEIRKTCVLVESGEARVHNNGACEAQDNEYRELLSDVKEKGTEASESVSSFPLQNKPEASSSLFSTVMRKGYGLKKWRRMKRDPHKVGETSVDTGKTVMQDLPNSVAHRSKRAQVYAEKERTPENSVSSKNPVVGNLDGLIVFGAPNLVGGPSMDAGTDSENNSSKSSTAARVPKVKYDVPVVVGFPYDKSMMRNLSGKNLAQKGQIDAIKKARGERMKTEKENSCSSVESDSRSSNYVFGQGPYATSNGVQSERAFHLDGENGDEIRGGRENEGGYEGISPQDVNTDASQEEQKEKSENHVSSSDQDPLFESILLLQTAKEALEEEVLKFKEISKDISVDDLVADIKPEITDIGKNFQRTSSEIFFLSGDGLQNISQAVHPEMVELAKRDAERELEDLFKQRIEAEVEYLTISRTVHKLWVPALDQITCSVEHNTPVLEKKTLMLKKEAEKLKTCYEGVASCDETIKLRKKVRKYPSYFLVQLLSLLGILGVFIFQLSPNYLELVPT